MDKSVTLSAEQLAQLSGLLSEMRHQVNNHLTLITAAAEIMTRKPETSARMMESIMQQPLRITQEIKRFSDAFEKTLGAQREPR